MVKVSTILYSNPILQSFVSKPYIQHALQNVHDISSVITFWFGVDSTTENGKQLLRSGSKVCMKDMEPLWYSGGPEFDTLCQPFSDIIHLAGTKSLPQYQKPTPLSTTTTRSSSTANSSNHWYTTVDGNVAQVILIDQLARNVFRGSDYAFKYGDVAINIARQLSIQYIKILSNKFTDMDQVCTTVSLGSLLSNKPCGDEIQLIDDLYDAMYPPYTSFLATALMHSEEKYDQELCQALIEHMSYVVSKNYYTSSSTNDDVSEQETKALYDYFQFQLQFANGHKMIIDRFNRYPHRNRILNRISTDDEVEWLADVDNLPGWAKSQG